MFPWDSDSFQRVSFRLSILGGCVLTEQRAHARLMNQVVALRNHNHSWLGWAQRPALGAHVSPPDGNQIWLKSFRNYQLAVPEMEPPPGCKASYVFLVRECVALGALQQCCAIFRCALWCYWVAYAQRGPEK